MKHIFLLLTTLVPTLISAQSSMLLPGRIELPKVATLVTCTSNEMGRMVYRISDNKAYYCNGSNWQEMTGGGFALPYSGTADTNSNLFKIVNEGNGRAIYAESQGNGLTVGIQAIVSHANPVIDNMAILGHNKSTNALGAGVYGRHDGKGIGVWGATADAGIGVKGLALPVNMGGTGTGIGVWAESTGGYGLFAKSNSWQAIRAESLTSDGIYGLSTEDAGVRGQSVNGIGLYGISNTRYGVYGYSYGTEGYGIYGAGMHGNAGYFVGNVKITRDLSVNDGNGIIQNGNSTQLKYYTGKVTYAYDLAAFGTAISDDIPIASFSAKPVVYIGDIENQTGAYYKVIVSIVSVDNNSVRLRFYNASNAAISFGATWNLIAIGAK